MNDVASAGLADAVIAIAIVEAACLVGYRWRTGRGIPVSRLLPNLCAGLLLMAGVRMALAGADWRWLAACFAAAGVAHLIDVRARWNGD